MQPRSFRSAALFAFLVALFVAVPATAVTEETVDTYPLAAGGSVSLDNVNGDVVVEAWDRAEVEVRATKIASDDERLAELRVEVDASADRVRIRTRYPDSRNHRGWFHDDRLEVEYALKVPRGARIEGFDLVNGSLDVSGIEGGVEASLVNGDLRGTSLGGDLQLETVNGRLEVELESLAGVRDISLDSVNGKIVLSLPAGADADLRASTVHGSIRNDLGLEVEKDGPVGREMRGRIGSGDVRIELETVNGSIDVRSR